MQDQITVSIVVLTYNHKDYIRQALDSILMQQCDFRYEILVGDDCSTDGTQQILSDYLNKYPDKFQLTLRDENVGATKNLYELLNSAKGTYLAYLEGDDYWLSANKLQLQVDFLQEHREYVGCSHKCLIVDENGTELKGEKYTDEENFWIFNNSVFQIDDFCQWKLPGQIATIVHKNVFLSYGMPPDGIIYMAHRTVADRSLVLVLLQYGDFFRFDELWSAYRRIQKQDRENWASFHKQMSSLEDDLLLRNNLNAYCMETYGKKIDSEELRWRTIVTGIIFSMRKPSYKNFQLTGQLFFKENDKLRCACFCAKKIGQKIIRRIRLRGS